MHITYFKNLIFWAVVGMLLFTFCNGNVHLFDWDEVNFAEIAREMIVSKNYLIPTINFETFTEKPPLFFWLQAISMQLFGVSEYAARLPNALLGVFVLPYLYHVGCKVRNSSFGNYWALAYAGSLLPSLYFKSGIIDPVFNLFIFIALYNLIQANILGNVKASNYRKLLVAGLFTALAVLTKGPVALLVIGATGLVYFMINKLKIGLSVLNIALYSVMIIVCTASWLLINYASVGGKFAVEFTIRQWQLLTTADAGHGGFFLYHFVVLFFGCFPAVGFTIIAFCNKEKENVEFADYKKWMAILFWVVLILFTLVHTKIVHYSSLCYYPLTFLAAWSMEKIITKKVLLKQWHKVMLLLSALPLLVAPMLLAFITKNIDKLKPVLKADAFATENIQAQVTWASGLYLPAIVLLFGLLLFFYFGKKQLLYFAIISLYLSIIVWVQLGLYLYINNVEAISQRANIEFWQNKKNEDAYLATYGYKSYTQYYYGEVKPQTNKNSLKDEWLFRGVIDKPVYFSCKPDLVDECKALTNTTFLYNKNGFYFFVRKP